MNRKNPDENYSIPVSVNDTVDEKTFKNNISTITSLDNNKAFDNVAFANSTDDKIAKFWRLLFIIMYKQKLVFVYIFC